jgi:hypothetical protein
MMLAKFPKDAGLATPTTEEMQNIPSNATMISVLDYTTGFGRSDLFVV